jgi:ATP-dependent RNA helicase DeaD
MNTFAEIGINNDIIKGLLSLGFQQPTPVQAKVIPLMLEKRVDMVSLAQTGTGKTAAFGVPLIQLTDGKNRRTQGLVLCPTRELCMQVARDMNAFARYVGKLNILAVYGGAAIEPQIKALRRGCQIIVATPGRLNDLINRGQVDLSSLAYVVFDEADEMLQMGFMDDLNAILAKTPPEKNTLLFSATMSKEVAAIARKMSDPVEITIGRRNAGAENVSHEYYVVRARDRYLALRRIIDNNPGAYGIIFCRTRKDTNEVANKLMQDGYNADALHGDLSQGQRDQVMKKFRRRDLQLLVATDVAARGLDVNDLTHVIHYNLPDDLAGYTHRSGRTGRAGRTGISLAIVHLKERYRIREIEKNIQKKFTLCRVPSGREICEKQLLKLLDTVRDVEVNHKQIDALQDRIAAKFADMKPEEIIQKFISLELSRFLEGQNGPDINVSASASAEKPRGKTARPRRDPGDPSRGRQNFSRFSLNVGRRDGILPQGLMGRINRMIGGGKIRIGKIEIMRNTTHIEADSKFSRQILDAFQDFSINGKTVVIKKAARDQGARRPASKSPQGAVDRGSDKGARRPKSVGIKRRKGPGYKVA